MLFFLSGLKADVDIYCNGTDHVGTFNKLTA